MKILYIDSCVSDDSRTKKLAEYLLCKLNGDIQKLNLEKEEIVPLNNVRLKKRDTLIARNEYSHSDFRYAREFASSDIIVIAAPYWDLSFPAILKNYIEVINVVGITFKYSNEGIPQKLCKAQKLFYVTTAGAMIPENDYGFGYIKSLAQNLYQIRDIKCFKAEMLDIAGSNVEEILALTKKEIDTYFK